jgi:hypothetical protein
MSKKNEATLAGICMNLLNLSYIFVIYPVGNYYSCNFNLTLRTYPFNIIVHFSGCERPGISVA